MDATPALRSDSPSSTTAQSTVGSSRRRKLSYVGLKFSGSRWRVRRFDVVTIAATSRSARKSTPQFSRRLPPEGFLKRLAISRGLSVRPFRGRLVSAEVRLQTPTKVTGTLGQRAFARPGKISLDNTGDFPSPWRFRLLTDEPTTGALHSLPSVGSIRPGTSVYPRGPDSRFAGRDRRSTAPSVGQSAPCEILRVPVASPSFDVVTIAVTGFCRVRRIEPDYKRRAALPDRWVEGEPPCERSRRGWESTTSKPVSRHLDAQPG